MSHFWWIVDLGCRNSSRVASHWRQRRRHFVFRLTVDRKNSRRWSFGHSNSINYIFCSKKSTFLKNCLLERWLLLCDFITCYNVSDGRQVKGWSGCFQGFILSALHADLIDHNCLIDCNCSNYCANNSASLHAFCHSKLAQTSAHIQVTKKHKITAKIKEQI